MKVMLLQKYRPCKPQPIDEEPCELYDSCADIMTPKEAMLKMLATGQQVDLNRRQAYYDSEEMEDYIEAEYPCDYITAYREFMEQKVNVPSRNKQDYTDISNSKKAQEPPKAQEPSKDNK